MIITIAFILTALVTLLFVAVIVSSIGESRTIDVPPLFMFKALQPTRWYILYPSLIFQIWFWSDKFNII